MPVGLTRKDLVDRYDELQADKVVAEKAMNEIFHAFQNKWDMHGAWSIHQAVMDITADEMSMSSGRKNITISISFSLV